MPSKKATVSTPGRGSFLRQSATDDVPERHQAQLQTFHEDHQANHDGDQTTANQRGILDGALEHDVLEQGQKQGQGHHCAGLLHEAGVEIGFQHIHHVRTGELELFRFAGDFLAVFVKSWFGHQLVIADGVRVDSDSLYILSKSDVLRHGLIPL
jgi:hypothetical protein